MSTVKQVAASLASLTVTGLSTLASATYVTSAAKDNTSNQPIDVVFVVEAATTNTPSGNKRLLVFAQASYDNSNWQSGPGSGTTTTDEPDLTLLGVLPINTSTTTHRKAFPIAEVFAGVVPPFVRLVIKNDLGVALTSAAVNTSEISATVA
ncbi:MAG: hypothetical protein JWL63_3228 [Rhodocyclales bacterium]|nr:hypothetical protein [Rhodocyclales bacterium]